MTKQRAAPDLAPLLLRIPDAARLMSVSRATLYEMIREGAIPVVYIGKSGQMRVEVAALHAFIDNHKVSR